MAHTTHSDGGKWQIRLLVREGAPNRQIRECLTVTKNLGSGPRRSFDAETDWPINRQS
jgi:hypothetical protein